MQTPETNAPELWRALWPWPAAEGHKYQRGHAVVVSGGPWRTGAARLAARAALRIGAGLVTVASPVAALPVHAAHLTAIMLHPIADAAALAAFLADPRITSLVIGPWLGVENRDLVEACLAATHPQHGPKGRATVLDADALTMFAGALGDLAGLVKAAPGPVVLTPHGGEFARLFGTDEGSPKVTRTLAAAAASGAIVVHKGAQTVIAHPDGRVVVSDQPMPWLSTAGSGDVLAGLIAGLVAQGMPAFAAACAGVWTHGALARSLGPGLIAEDLPEAVPAFLAWLGGGS